MTYSRGIPSEGRESYFTARYLNEGRFVDYHHAYRLALENEPSDLLEIGPGNGLLTWLLRQSGRCVTTLDIDSAVRPDVLGSVEAMPFSDRSFDTVLCIEVLEHLPWDDFGSALSEIHRVTRKRVVLSLPHVGRYWMLVGTLPLLGGVWGSVDLPSWNPPDFANHPEHYWSIGSKGCRDSEVKDRITAAGFVIRNEYRPLMNRCHKFFVLERSR